MFQYTYKTISVKYRNSFRQSCCQFEFLACWPSFPQHTLRALLHTNKELPQLKTVSFSLPRALFTWCKALFKCCIDLCRSCKELLKCTSKTLFACCRALFVSCRALFVCCRGLLNSINFRFVCIRALPAYERGTTADEKSPATVKKSPTAQKEPCKI